jgi:beta propeller repeat protein
MYNISFEEETPVCILDEDQRKPDVYGDFIVWEGERIEDGDMKYVIYIYKISEPDTHDFDYGRNPRIYEKKVVYQSRPDQYVKLYNNSGTTRKQINNAVSWGMTVYQNRIIWFQEGDANDTMMDIMMYDLGPDGKFNTSDDIGERLLVEDAIHNLSAPYHLLEIYDNNVVWIKNETYLYLHKISENVTYNLSTNTLEKTYLNLYENKVVYQSYIDNGSDYDIYSYDLNLNIEMRITTNNYSQWQPDIYENTIVWLDERSGNYRDIYICNYPTYPTYPYLNIGNKSNVSIPRANKNIKDFVEGGGLSQLENMTLPEWAWYFGQFTEYDGTQLIFDFAGVLNQYLFNNVNEPGMLNETGYLNIPLTFHSDTRGILYLTNIKIRLEPYFSDPFWSDTDDDGLLDSYEYSIYTYSLKMDSDNDGLWDVIEPVKGIKTDPLDSDSENDLLMDGNSDELKVIFRVGSSNGTFINYTNGTWIAIQNLIYISELSSFVTVSDFSRLPEYGFDRNESSLPAENASIIFNTTENYGLFYINSTNEIYVKLNDGDYKVYNLSDSDTQWANNLTSPQIDYAINNQEIYSNAALTADKDNDGLIDGIESALGLTSTDADWDDDGLLDGIEYYIVGSNPLLNDTDGDGLWDGLEVGITLTDVWNVRWNFEVNQLIYGTNLSKFSDHYDSDPNSTTDPRLKDSDLDGIWDGFKDYGTPGIDPTDPGEDRNLNGNSENENETDPNNRDTDGDGLIDGYGENNDGDAILEEGETNPMDIDTDDDGLWDGQTISYNGILYLGELSYYTESRNNDSDYDDILDGTEIGLIYNVSDTSNDTIFDDNEALQLHPYVKGTNSSIFVSDLDPQNVTNPNNDDSDDDGLKDGVEDENQNGYFENNYNETDPLNKDTDYDGFKDGDEDIDKDGIFEPQNNETNPNDADSDDDGIKDNEEILWNLDSDEDGQINAIDDDSDNDGILDGVEIGIITENKVSGGYGYNGTADSYSGDNDPTTTTNPIKRDSDYDNLPDGWVDGWSYDWDYGWGIYNSNDSARQKWEGEDLDCDGKIETTGGTYGNETDNDNWDTDSDRILDNIEAFFGLDPNYKPDAEEDLDNDNLTNLYEYLRGTNKGDFDIDFDNDENINFNDTNDDNDAFPTEYEVYYGLNPYGNDEYKDFDGDGLTNIYEYNESLDPSNPDTDDDGLWDGWVDTRGDQIYEDWETKGEWQWNTDPLDPDYDNDTLWDGDEVEGWWVFLEGSEYWVYSNPLVADNDSDDFNDSQEYLRTDPEKEDTDGDGLIDYVAENGTGNGTVPEGKDTDPTTKEDVPPKIKNIDQYHELIWSGFIVEKVYLRITVKVTDNVEIEYVNITFKDNGKKYQAESIGNDKYRTKFEIDFWEDYTYGYEVDVKVYDIAGNEMGYVVGGGLQYVVGKLVGAILSFFTGPFIAGTVMGFFVGMLSGIFEDLSIFLQIGEIFDGLTQIGTLIPQLISNPGMIWEMIKNSLYGIINKAFNFNPFGQGGYTVVQWVDNVTNLVSDFFDNWNVDDEELQNFISADANKFNLAFTAAYLVGYIIQQMMVGGFMLVGKLNEGANIVGNLRKIGSKLKDGVKAVGRMVKNGASKAKMIAKGFLDKIADKVCKYIDDLGMKLSQNAFGAFGVLMVGAGGRIVDDVAKYGKEIIENIAERAARRIEAGLDAFRPNRQTHVLNKHSLNVPGKKGSTFPKGWSDPKILDSVEDVADTGKYVGQGTKGSKLYSKTIDGVEITIAKGDIGIIGVKKVKY